MRSREGKQAVYDAAIPKGHFLRNLKDLLDWHYLAGELTDCYRSKGRALSSLMISDSLLCVD